MTESPNSYTRVSLSTLDPNQLRQRKEKIYINFSIRVDYTNLMACCCLNPSVSSADDSFSEEFLTDTDPPEQAVKHETKDPEVQEETHVDNDGEDRLIDDENTAIAQDQQVKAKEKSQRPKIRTTTERLYHGGINMRREMVRIDMENRFLLRRLTNVKPSAGMKRSEQLAEYDRLPHYRAVCNPTRTIFR